MAGDLGDTCKTEGKITFAVAPLPAGERICRAHRPSARLPAAWADAALFAKRRARLAVAKPALPVWSAAALSHAQVVTLVTLRNGDAAHNRASGPALARAVEEFASMPMQSALLPDRRAAQMADLACQARKVGRAEQADWFMLLAWSAFDAPAQPDNDAPGLQGSIAGSTR